MKLNEVLSILDERGHSLTRASLYRAGVKNGFLTREPYGKTFRYVIDDANFNKWLDKATTKVPDDCIKLTDLCKQYNLSYTSLKSMCDSGELKSYNYGAGIGVTYVKLREVEFVVGIHNQNN